MDVGEGGACGAGLESAKPKSKPRTVDAFELVWGGLALEKRMEDVVDVCEDGGWYSKPGLCGDLEEIDEVEYCRSITSTYYCILKGMECTIAVFRSEFECALFAAEETVTLLSANSDKFLL